MLIFVYLFSKSSLSVLKMVYKHDAATEDPSNYRLSVPNIDPKHDSLQVQWHPICAGNCLEIWRATSDVHIYDFDIQLNWAENGLQTWLASPHKDVFGAWYVINESWKHDSLHVIKFKFCNSKCNWSICYKHDIWNSRNKSSCVRTLSVRAECDLDTWLTPISVLSLDKKANCTEYGLKNNLNQLN